MYQLDWNINFKNKDGDWRLGILAECEIEKSVKNLADFATIILPEADMNIVLKIQDFIKRSDEVRIKLGYDGKLETEFQGYVKEIITEDSSLKILCEDGLFLFRKGIKNKEFKPASVKQIAQYVVGQIDQSYKVVCTYDLPYDKFTIYQATGFDVLAKLQEETGADIYFDMQNKELHIHPAYTRKAGEVDYSMQHNIETSSLEYKSADDRKVEVTVESVGLDGKTISKTVGQTGGDKITKKVGRMSANAIKIIADTEYSNKMAPGYEGSFDAWLLPYVEPNFTVGIYDKDYPYKDGRYYAESVVTNFSENGGKRTITPGIKLSK
ncbi:hypothetical protein FNJ88_06295 [Chryseobacterium sp. SNU WT5]|uniref:hypothetical protein n=1 Tax=Chryseobacterium sp. SNU WT5 TaxID=2594269 RepID=UPI00117EAC62|nr:hypothetical protein [Chryseobacterium sp. SNU WT5]QDP85192.1 hypothetical protein FNJ88_06295 [Chryseobacterium sp. SNU WT5]